MNTAERTVLIAGQGSSLALAGAYLLAHALHTAAFAAYERDLRGFVARNQALVDTGGSTFVPVTAEALRRRDTMLRGLDAMPSATTRPEHSALVLPAFGTWP
ncbi:hypothetical protein [Catenuloplanes japonicus]|uniref:hypothetical protein n=1 Tax=Catenuloplanes japonicus TaxID=33876 RepID=UPI000526FF4D|nr:hypothetical protein [Catenuloplanes japonicus]